MTKKVRKAASGFIGVDSDEGGAGNSLGSMALATTPASSAAPMVSAEKSVPVDKARPKMPMGTPAAGGKMLVAPTPAGANPAMAGGGAVGMMSSGANIRSGLNRMAAG